MANILKGDKKTMIFKLALLVAAAVSVLSIFGEYFSRFLFGLYIGYHSFGSIVADLFSMIAEVLPLLMVALYLFLFMGKEKAKLGEALVFGAAAISCYIVSFIDTIGILEDVFYYIERGRFERLFEEYGTVLWNIFSTNTQALFFLVAAILALVRSKKMRFPLHVIPVGLVVVSNIFSVISVGLKSVQALFSFGREFAFYLYYLVSYSSEFWAQLMFLVAVALVAIIPMIFKAPEAAQEAQPVEVTE